MNRYVLLFFLLLLGTTFKASAQIPISFSSRQLIGSWEIDYASAKECDSVSYRPSRSNAKTIITFLDSTGYTMILRGVLSNGYYSLDMVEGDIVFSPTVNTDKMNLSERRNKVVLINDSQMILMIDDCKVPYQQVFFRVQ